MYVVYVVILDDHLDVMMCGLRMKTPARGPNIFDIIISALLQCIPVIVPSDIVPNRI